MNKQQFKEAAIYATNNLTADDYNTALEAIGNKQPLPHHICTDIADSMNDWCNDNDLKTEAWRMIGDEADVILAGDDPDKQQAERQDSPTTLFYKPRTLWMLSTSLQHFLFWKEEDAIKEYNDIIADYQNRNNDPEHPYTYNLISDDQKRHFAIIECVRKDGRYRTKSMFVNIREYEVY